MASPAERFPQLCPQAVCAAYHSYRDTHIGLRAELLPQVVCATPSVAGVRTVSLSVCAWRPPELKLLKQAVEPPRLDKRSPDCGRFDEIVDWLAADAEVTT